MMRNVLNLKIKIREEEEKGKEKKSLASNKKSRIYILF